MTLSVVSARFDHLLASADPRIIMLTGGWGVGKTYQWKAALTRYSANNSLSPLKYAYVSLFGLASTSELRRRIAEEMVSSISMPGGKETVGDQIVDPGWKAKPLQLLKLIPAIPYLSSLESVANELSFRTVRNAVICIDDLERAPSLSLVDVLGLLSFLKEERGCRIVVLTNARALDERKEALERYLEKVVDEKIELEPTAAESAEIAVKGSKRAASTLLAQNSEKLALTNVRVIEKLHRLALELEDILVDDDPRVLRQAISTLTLYGLAHLVATERVPSIEYIDGYGGDEWARFFAGASDPAKMTPQQKQAAEWHDFLQRYGYGKTDDLDREIGKAVRQGFVDDERLRKLADPLTQGFKQGDLKSSLAEARTLLTDSYDDNSAEVVNAFDKAIQLAAHLLSLPEMHFVYSVLRELAGVGHAERALETFIARNQSEAWKFDLSHDHFGDVRLPEFRARIEAEQRRHHTEVTVEAALDRIAANGGGGDARDFSALAEAEVVQIHALIRNARGEQRSNRVRAMLRLGRIGGDATYPTIYSKAIDALRMIAREGGINALRVKHLIPDAPTAEREDG